MRYNGGSWVLGQTYSSGSINAGQTTLSYTLASGTGTYDFYTLATDNVGNTESALGKTTEGTITYLELPPPVTTVTSFPAVNQDNQTAVTLTGTCTNGIADAIDFMIADGYVPTPHVLATVPCTAGEWSTTQDLSGLADKTLTATVTQSNVAGNTPGGNTKNSTKDTAVSNVWSVYTFPSALNPSSVTNASFTGLVAGDAGATVNWVLSSIYQ